MGTELHSHTEVTDGMTNVRSVSHGASALMRVASGSLIQACMPDGMTNGRCHTEIAHSCAALAARLHRRVCPMA